jgi:hypothetical protein
MKSQGSRPSGTEILQSQNSPSDENRIQFNRLAVVHGRLCLERAKLSQGDGYMLRRFHVLSRRRADLPAKTLLRKVMTMAHFRTTREHEDLKTFDTAL